MMCPADRAQRPPPLAPPAPPPQSAGEVGGGSRDEAEAAQALRANGIDDAFCFSGHSVGTHGVVQWLTSGIYTVRKVDG